MPAKRKPSSIALQNSRSRELERKFEKLEKQFEQLQKQYAQLQGKCQQQQARIDELEAKLAKAQKTSRNSSKPPSSDITKPPSSAPATTPDGKRKRGGQPGHRQHTRPGFNPDQIDHIQRIPLGGCPCCGNHLTELDVPPEKFHQAEVAARPVVVTEFQRSSGWCEHCRTSVKPDWPPGLVEAGLTGPGLIALMFTFFRVSPSRGSQVLLDVLGKEFDGLLGCDYFSAYRKYMSLNENVRLQFCLAHLIRDVKFLVTHPAGANRDHGEQLLELLRKMFSIIHRRDEYATEAGYRNALSRIRNEIVYKAAMEAPQTQEALNLSERFFQHTESYFQFITEPTLAPTNNVAEQAFRFVAIQRRITQGTRGRAGQLWSERIWTVIATCGQQGRSAYEYLVSAITAHCRHQPIPSLVLVGPNSS